MNNRLRKRLIVGRNRQRGLTMLDLLVSGLVLSISLMALCNMTLASFNMTRSADSRGTAYQLARRVVEGIKQTGFDNTSDGTTTQYYDFTISSSTTSQTSASRFKVVYTLTTGAGAQSYLKIRTLVTTVTLVSNNDVVYTSTTYLAKGGI